MTKDELIDAFGVNNWKYEKDDPYRKKLLELTRNIWDSVIPLDILWNQYRRVITENGAVVLTAQTPFDKILGCSNLDMLRYEWIWEKTQGTGHLNSKKMPLKNHENILIFYKKLPTYNPQLELGIPYTAKYSTHSSNYGKQKDGVVTENEGFASWS